MLKKPWNISGVAVYRQVGSKVTFSEFVGFVVEEGEKQRSHKEMWLCS